MLSESFTVRSSVVGVLPRWTLCPTLPYPTCLWSEDVVREPVDKLHFMMTSSNGNIFRVTGPLCGEFTGPGEFPAQRPVTRSFDIFFDLRPNKRLSKQPWGWWFETPSWSLWRQCNVRVLIQVGPMACPHKCTCARYTGTAGCCCT